VVFSTEKINNKSCLQLTWMQMPLPINGILVNFLLKSSTNGTCGYIASFPTPKRILSYER